MVHAVMLQSVGSFPAFFASLAVGAMHILRESPGHKHLPDAGLSGQQKRVRDASGVGHPSERVGCRFMPSDFGELHRSRVCSDSFNSDFQTFLQRCALGLPLRSFERIYAVPLSGRQLHSIIRMCGSVPKSSIKAEETFQTHSGIFNTQKYEKNLNN